MPALDGWGYALVSPDSAVYLSLLLLLLLLTREVKAACQGNTR
jgi:hypothetical protein